MYGPFAAWFGPHADTQPKPDPAPAVVSAAALEAADTGPYALTDTALIATLCQQISIRDQEIRRLREATSTGPLPQRHPAAGTPFDDDTTADTTGLRRQVETLHTVLAETRQQLADARKRLGDHETAERDGSCVDCLGHQRTIADLKAAGRADRKRIAELDLTLRFVATELARAQAHRELAAEAS